MARLLSQSRQIRLILANSTFRSNLITRSFCIVPEPRNPNEQLDGLAGKKPTKWQKKFLVWSGVYKSAEDIPDVVHGGQMRQARDKLRGSLLIVIFCYVAGVLGFLIYKNKANLKNQLEYDKRTQFERMMVTLEEDYGEQKPDSELQSEKLSN